MRKKNGVIMYDKKKIIIKVKKNVFVLRKIKKIKCYKKNNVYKGGVKEISFTLAESKNVCFLLMNVPVLVR